MDMEDCKEMIISTSSNNQLHACSSGGVAPQSVPPASTAVPASLASSYLHQHLQPQQEHQIHHGNAHRHQPPSQSPPLLPQNPHQLPPAHQHFNHSLILLHDPNTDDILMRRSGTEPHTCADDTSARSTNMDGTPVLLHSTGGVDAGLLNPHQSYSSMHTPKATRPNSEPTLGMNVAMHLHEDLGIISNPSVSEATPPQPPDTQQIMHIAMGLPSPDPFKRKKGRARKCSVDATSSIALFTVTKTDHHSGERAQMGALVQGLMPYVIAIARGEDVSIRITSFQQEGNWGICVLSALGLISNVTLRHSETSGGTITYEGFYDILSLSGSLLPIGDGGFQSRGGLVVSLAGLDGRVIGGEVTGIFVAASPVKVVVGTFLSEACGSQMGGTVQNISQAETAMGSPSCATIPLQSTIY